MKVVFCVYHDINTNGRSQHMLKCAQELGDAVLVSYSEPGPDINGRFKFVQTGGGKRKYAQFIAKAISTIRREKPDIIILHDNYCACFLPYIGRINPKPFLIYDSSELYIDKKPTEFKEFVSSILQWFENSYLKTADFVIAANQERAKIMESFFSLDTLPYTYENIRRIEEQFDETYCRDKYDQYISKRLFTVLYAGGISHSRRTYELVEAIKTLGSNYQLLIAGKVSRSEKEAFDKYLEGNNITNVAYIGYISRGELKYLFQNVQVSVSMFAHDTLNNKNCASGKFYESLFEGVPMLTSTNPPLLRICAEHGVGVSTEDFMAGLIELRSNYSTYCNSVKKFINTIDLDMQHAQLVHTIRSAYSAYN